MNRHRYTILFVLVVTVMLSIGVWTLVTPEGRDFYCWSKTLGPVNADPVRC